MNKHPLTIGVLAFHGDVAEHIAILKTCGACAGEVRTIDDLKCCSGLIIPGGESTVIEKFLTMTGMGTVIQERVRQKNLAVLGTCAGAILLAHHVVGSHKVRSLNLIDITIERNAYGTQRESFEAQLEIPKLQRSPLNVAFIRAPKITNVGKGVEVLASYNGTPVLIEQGNVLAATFHPEVRSEYALHLYFLEKCRR